jgi:hypothetical protein
MKTNIYLDVHFLVRKLITVGKGGHTAKDSIDVIKGSSSSSTSIIKLELNHYG